MTATFDALYPGRRQATQWKGGALRPCGWCGVEQVVRHRREFVCRACQSYESFAKQDARMVRCPYCDSLKMPETDHECKRKRRED